jgi:hypothetical protein
MNPRGEGEFPQRSPLYSPTSNPLDDLAKALGRKELGSCSVSHSLDAESH